MWSQVGYVNPSEEKAVPNEGTWIIILLEVTRWFQLVAKCCPIKNIQQIISHYQEASTHT